MIIQLARKVHRHGFLKSVQLSIARCIDYFNAQQLRTKAHRQEVALQWCDIVKQHNLNTSFQECFYQLQKGDFQYLENIMQASVFQQDMCSIDDLKNNCFELLGSGKCCFTHIPWHDDFKIHKSFQKNVFYKDIVIQSGMTEKLTKDIKIPWELSRFGHVAILGRMYKHTHDQALPLIFKAQIDDWIVQNPLLLGPNWVCPMDVAIRAINWIWGFYFFKTGIKNFEFWQCFICSLYDHMLYLERNWEKYGDMTSNHYLSDLVGYLYLTHFFSNFHGIKKKFKWCAQEIIQEFDKQVFEEGTDYEGSTSYHCLVTELFYHAFMLFASTQIFVSKAHQQKLKRMFQFIKLCSINEQERVQIGDNDSGKITFGISKSVIEKYAPENREGVFHYQQFGLSIIKIGRWHITLRHHAYKRNQPSGHFHNDIGSITVAIDKIPVFVDPGSYVYTASTVWRNRFRSINMHNTACLNNQNPVSLDDGLFYMQIPEHVVCPWHEVETKSGKIRLCTYHELFSYLGFGFLRELIFDEHNGTLTMNDSWVPLEEVKQTSIEHESFWNFTLAPAISVEREAHKLRLMHKKKPLLYFESDLDFEVIPGFYSPVYGVKQECMQLRSCAKVTSASFQLYHANNNYVH